MLSDEMRAQLSRLASQTVSHAIARPGGPTSRPPRQQTLRLLPPDASTEAIRFERSQATICQTGSGAHLRLQFPLARFWPAATTSVPQIAKSLMAQPGALDLHPELAAVAEHFPQRTMFLDLETCGFAGAPVFLAGVVWFAGESLVVDQLFARDYSEERALLETLAGIATAQRVLATFNGKSFDWPMVCDRSIRHRLATRAAVPLRKRAAVSGEALVHCDLLHHARRRWKHVLPNCKLQTLERWVCRRTRHGDVGGADVPAAYHQFVRTGEWSRMEEILLHNALDLVTLVDVTLRLLWPRPVNSEQRLDAG